MPAEALHRDLDDETDVKYCAIGPGRRKRTSGPVIDAYADGAIDRHCPNCAAEPLQFCRHDDGTPRKMPCSHRLSETP